MYNSKLIVIFQSFSKSEKALFRRWILTPAHNQRQDVIVLVDYLLSRRKITGTSVKRERVFKQVYPNASYDLYQLNHLLSITVKLMEDFIKYLMSKKSPFKEGILLNLYYKQRNIPHLANKALLKAKSELEATMYKNEQFYYNNFTLEIAHFDLAGTEQRRQDTNLEAIFDNLAVFTIISTLRFACIAISHKSLFRTDYYIPLLDAILIEAAKDTYEENRVVKCYYYSYLALTKPEEEEHFEALRDILLYQELPLKSDELKQVSLLAINYCIKRLNAGAEKYVQEVFDIYKFGLERQIWLENGFLSHNTFKNIATAALRLQAYEWTNGFIKIYGPQIKASHQKDYTNYIKAKLLFEQGAYAQAQTLMMKTEAIDLFIGMAIKILLLKIYWKLKEYSVLEAHLDSFTVYLNRKKDLSHRQFYSNIILITRKIVQANLTIPKEKERLRKLIMETNPLTERPWLLKQLDSK